MINVKKFLKNYNKILSLFVTSWDYQIIPYKHHQKCLLYLFKTTCNIFVVSPSLNEYDPHHRSNSIPIFTLVFLNCTTQSLLSHFYNAKVKKKYYLTGICTAKKRLEINNWRETQPAIINCNDDILVSLLVYFNVTQ